MATYRKLFKPAVWILYIVIGLEFLFMISPFALYFYSSYGPALNLLHESPITSWLSGFFLPHVFVTTSPLLNALKPWGFRIAGLGLLLFLAGVVQIYGAKLFRRKEVTGGLYRISRHPQYAALAVLGFGVLLIWPRFLVLMAYVTMLFLYYLLARWEEKQCLEKYGDGYREYMERVGFFLPKSLTSWVPSAPGWTRRPAGVAVLFVAALGLALVAAVGLRTHSLSRISALWEDERAVLSPAVLDEAVLKEVVTVAEANSDVTARLEAAPGDGPWIIYIVPANWYLPDLPLNRWDEIPADQQGGHSTPKDFDRDRFKVLFTQARTHFPDSRGRQIVERAYGRTPLVRAQIDLASDTVLAVEDPPANVVWGDIPTPLF